MVIRLYNHQIGEYIEQLLNDMVENTKKYVREISNQ